MPHKIYSCWDLFGVHQLKEPPMKNTLGCLEIQSGVMMNSSQLNTIA